jgi:hypothetical protein
MYLIEARWENVVSIYLARDGDRWKTLVNTVMYLRNALKTGIPSQTASKSCTLLDGIS